jgi:hypothetical protein
MSTLREAAQQALEALECCVKALDALHAPGDSIYTRASDLADRAEIALRAALAQQDLEPLSVEALARALVASRVIDAAAIDDPEGYDDGVMLDQVRAAYRRLAALAQQEQRSGRAALFG